MSKERGKEPRNPRTSFERAAEKSVPNPFKFFPFFVSPFQKKVVPLHPKSTKFFAYMTKKTVLHYHIPTLHIHIPYHHNISTYWDD